MANPTAIFINPEKTSKLYKFFNDDTDLTAQEITTTGDTEPTIASILARVNLVNNGVIVFIVPQGLTTTFVDKDQIDVLEGYIGNNILYTNTFLDNCFNRVNLTAQPGDAMKNYLFQTTTDPSGLAIAGIKQRLVALLTAASAKSHPSASSKISSVFKDGVFKAVTSVPLLMPYDVGTIVDPSDTLRSYQCKVESIVADDHNVENLGLFWFAAGAAAVILLVWLASYKLDKRSALIQKY
jgi:hypothetical protein